MNKKTELVFKGFLELTSEEREEFIAEWDKYRKEIFTVQKSIRENLSTRLSLGPLPSNGCPCCGR